jgi:hypothetical protein
MGTLFNYHSLLSLLLVAPPNLAQTHQSVYNCAFRIVSKLRRTSNPRKRTMANSLILDSLEIRRFRAFRSLRIERLAQVNLIVGKNNEGKTSLLEALWLYAERGAPCGRN